MKAWLAAAGLMIVTAQTATAQSIDARNPANVVKALAEMGYKVATEIGPGEFPLFNADINGIDTGFVFGDCSSNTPPDCKYFVLVSNFSDIVNPPVGWLNGLNQNIDLGKFWINQNHILTFSSPVAIGNGQLSRETFRFVLNQWTGIAQYVRQSAKQEKLVK